MKVKKFINNDYVMATMFLISYIFICLSIFKANNYISYILNNIIKGFLL